MGDKVRAGCPWRNLQATVDGLTGAGLSVAVYEEVFEPNSRKKKTRYLSQVLTPGASTYVRDREGTGGFTVTSTCECSDEMCQRKCPLFENSTRGDLSSQDMSGNSELTTVDSRDHRSLSKEW